MRTKIKTIRIKYSDYKDLRLLFPAKYGESLVDYFSRLTEFLAAQSEVLE